MKKIIFALTVLLISKNSFLSAQELTVDQIVDKANLAAYYGGDDGKSKVKMTITDKQGRTRVREFVILRKNVTRGGEQKFYVYFQAPPDVRDMVYMVWKHIGKDDDRWLYLPALDLVKRVAASDKRSSFVGSHFVYEDVSGRSINDDIHELVENSDKVYKLKNTPKDKNSVEFSYYFVSIDKKTFLPIKAEYYDNQNKLYRIVEATETREIQGIPTVTKSKVTDLNTGGNTESIFSNVEYNIGIGDDIFTERYLRRPPKKWLN